MSRLTLFSAILVFAGAGPVLAQDADFARTGIYAGISMAGAYYTEIEDDVKKDIEPVGYTGDTKTERPLGLGLSVGYRFHPRLAAEAQFQWFTKSTTDFSGLPIPIPDKAKNSDFDVLKIETLNFYGNLKGYILTGRIQPFVVAGAGLMHLNANDKFNLGTVNEGDAFAARFGGGVDLYLNANLAFSVEGNYVLATGKLDNLDQGVWSVGLKYRF